MIRALRFGLVSTFSAALIALPPALSAQAATPATHPAADAVQDVAGEALLPPGVAGAYLAARQASRDKDYSAAARYTGDLLARKVERPAVMETAIQSDLALGDFASAARVSAQMHALGIRSQVGQLVRIADQLGKAQYEAVLTELSKNQGVGPLVDGLVTGWADLGAGKMSEASAAFDRLAKTPGMQPFGLYHKALALASVGDFEGAEKILGDDHSGLRLTRRGLIAEAEVLSQLEKNGAALKLLDDNFVPGRDPGADALRARLKAGETLPFTIVRSPRDGLAEVFYTVATALQGQASNSYVLLFSQIALHLRPHLASAALLSAGLLSDEGQYDIALKTYASIPQDDPAHFLAEMGRADVLYAQGQKQEATAAMTDLAKAYPKVINVQISYGDLLRRQKMWAGAIKAYDNAIALIGPKPAVQQWSVFYLRGIAEERSGDWTGAEPDLREALKLNPDQPDVLNYLGYALVDRGEKLDEALAMIKKAVSERPDDGYIRDSLGWAYYKLGEYDKALTVMEKASQLEPVDPVVTDHLGDVYWMVGRKLEAQFQWRRALAYGPDADEIARIRLKLEKGLDAVRRQEGKDGGKSASEPAKATAPAPGAKPKPGATNGG